VQQGAPGPLLRRCILRRHKDEVVLCWRVGRRRRHIGRHADQLRVLVQCACPPRPAGGFLLISLVLAGLSGFCFSHGDTCRRCGPGCGAAASQTYMSPAAPLPVEHAGGFICSGPCLNVRVKVPRCGWLHSCTPRMRNSSPARQRIQQIYHHRSRSRCEATTRGRDLPGTLPSESRWLSDQRARRTGPTAAGPPPARSSRQSPACREGSRAMS
jgi:hypothetical protein